MNIYTNKFSQQQEKKIKEFFIQKQANFSDMRYAFWKAAADGYSAVFYNSGKFVIQGKEVSSLVSDFEKFMNISSKINDEQNKSDEEIVIPADEYIGTDESGKGDFFGPLVTAGVLINPELKDKFINLGIKDSKKLDDKTITRLSAHIRNSAVHSVVVIMPEKYNQLYASFKNLNKLLAWGHARVIENILEKKICTYALSDKFGDESLIQNSLMKLGQNINLVQKVRGESDIAVAAASVIARAEFVKRMDEMSRKYGIDFPKGASDKVIHTAKFFCDKFGKVNIHEVSKTHFKTAKLL